MHNNPYETYRNNTVFTATKEELTLMLYDGALKFCNQAIVALEKNDFGRTNDMMLKVQNIIREFQLTLNSRYEISTQLDLLYDYLYNRLVEANMKKDMAILTEVRDHIRSMRDTWKEAMKASRASVKTEAVRN
ncbi:MAG: flagellar export chaperone FliS [Clostridiales bacterium]|nr:flagellar export chaperone FliS [Clostridiales bacterium]